MKDLFVEKIVELFFLSSIKFVDCVRFVYICNVLIIC